MVNTSSFSPLNTNVNTNLRYYRKQAINKKLKLLGGAMKFFTKKLLGYEIFSSMIPWVTKYFLKNLLKPPTPTPTPPTYLMYALSYNCFDSHYLLREHYQLTLNTRKC